MTLLVKTISSSGYLLWVAITVIARPIAERLKHTTTTRLFIFDEFSLRDSKALIAQVIEDQVGEGIGCALAIHDDFEREALTYKTLDFAIFDSDRAVSFFRGLARDYSVTFRTGEPAHDIEIMEQLDTYYRLLPECWLVSDDFRVNQLATTSKQRMERLGQATKGRTERLKSLNLNLGDDTFPVVVNKGEKVLPKLDRMLDFRAKYNQR